MKTTIHNPMSYFNPLMKIQNHYVKIGDDKIEVPLDIQYSLEAPILWL